jgi:hypothetical protein
VVSFLAVPFPLRAQGAPNSIEIGGGGGRFYGGSMARGSNSYFDEKVFLDDDKQLGFWIGAQITRDWGFQVDVRRSSTDIVRPAAGVFPTEPTLATLDFATVEASVTRSFWLGSFAPYLVLGAGVANVDINVPDRAVRDTNRFTISGGGGGRFYFAKWCGARVDLRARETRLQDGHWLSTVDLLGGVFFAFGGRP